MRQTISGLIAGIAVVAASAAPAMACGYDFGYDVGYVSPCAQNYIPAPVYSGCDFGCGGWAYERLPDPVQQYYYVDQGPTYSGPGNFAPYPVYREGTVYGSQGYRHYPHHYGYHHHRHTHHGYSHRYGYREHTLRRYY